MIEPWHDLKSEKAEPRAHETVKNEKLTDDVDTVEQLDKDVKPLQVASMPLSHTETAADTR